nr:FtsX-like permease family protein [Tissierella sp.]
MESLKRSLKYQFRETKGFLLGFWGTVILVDILFYILNSLSSNRFIDFSSNGGSINFSIGFSLGNTGSSDPLSVVGVNFLIIAISMIVYNYKRNYERFPLALSLGMTRRDYFLSFLMDNIFMAFMMAGIQGLLLKIDPILMELVGKEALYEFVNFNLKTDNVLYIILTLFILFLIVISSFNLLASLNYKFGSKLWIVIVAFNILVTAFRINIFDKIFEWIGRITVTRFGLFEIVAILGSIALIYALNYFVTIKTNIKEKAI